MDFRFGTIGRIKPGRPAHQSLSRIEWIAGLEKARVRYGQGTPFLRLAGIKIFADGSLGSQTAFCFDKYKGSGNNFGVETTTRKDWPRKSDALPG